MLGKKELVKKKMILKMQRLYMNSENENVFITRATHSTVPSAPPSNDYLPPSANQITPELREKWGIKYEDFFTIFCKGADELLDSFQHSVQHRNQV